VQGIDLTKAKALIRQSLALHGNAITIWTNQDVKAASKNRLTACLR
jgi:hypothetical protein